MSSMKRTAHAVLLAGRWGAASTRRCRSLCGRIGFLLCGALLATLLVPPRSMAADRVTVSVDKRGYTSGSPITVSIRNRGRTPVYLMGCPTWTVEVFQDEGFKPLPIEDCQWEKEAIELPPGEKTFEWYRSTADEIRLRLSVVYGTGCAKGLPLSRARCKNTGVAVSPSFVIRPAKPK